VEEKRMKENLGGIGESEGFLHSTEPIHYAEELTNGYKSAFRQAMLRGITKYIILIIISSVELKAAVPKLTSTSKQIESTLFWKHSKRRSKQNKT
jgi:hypothetical protein